MVREIDNRLNLIKKTFDILDEFCFEFVLLRGIDAIESQHSNKDFDLLVRPKDIRNLEQVLLDFGYTVSTENNKGMLYLYGASPSKHFRINEAFIHFDITAALQYRALNGNAIVAVNTVLQEAIFAEKKSVEAVWRYIPSPEDELTHLCCRSIFDHNKVLKTHKQRMEILRNEVDETRLLAKLKLIFYKFSGTLWGIIQENKFTSVFDEYISFTDY